MVKAQELIRVFQTMQKERWKYTWSAAEKGNALAPTPQSDPMFSVKIFYHVFRK